LVPFNFGTTTKRQITKEKVILIWAPKHLKEYFELKESQVSFTSEVISIVGASYLVLESSIVAQSLYNG